jgi:hypothetical protein
MKGFPIITGYLIPDAALVFIFSTAFWCLLYGAMLGFPEGFPDELSAEAVLFITIPTSVLYAISYWIHLKVAPQTDEPDTDR